MLEQVGTSLFLQAENSFFIKYLNVINTVCVDNHPERYLLQTLSHLISLELKSGYFTESYSE